MIQYFDWLPQLEKLNSVYSIENELVICQYSEVLLELSDDMPFHGDTMSNPHKFDFFMFVYHMAGSAVVKIDMAEFVLDNPRNFIKLGPGQIVSMEKVSEDFDADIIIMSKRFVEGLMVFVNGAIPIRFNVSRGMPVEHIDQGLYSFSAVLTAIALASVFYKPSWRSAMWATLGILVTVVVQAAMNVWVQPFGVATLTAPFCITTWLFLLPLLKFDEQHPDHSQWHHRS